MVGWLHLGGENKDQTICPLTCVLTRHSFAPFLSPLSRVFFDPDVRVALPPRVPARGLPRLCSALMGGVGGRTAWLVTCVPLINIREEIWNVP